MQFALSAVVEKPERRVAALLDLGQDDARADGVDGAGGNKDDVAFRDPMPLNQFNDRVGLDRGTQFLWRDTPLQPDADLRVRFRGQDVPCFGLAVRDPDRVRKGIVGMDLN